MAAADIGEPLDPAEIVSLDDRLAGHGRVLVIARLERLALLGPLGEHVPHRLP